MAPVRRLLLLACALFARVASACNTVDEITARLNDGATSLDYIDLCPVQDSHWLDVASWDTSRVVTMRCTFCGLQLRLTGLEELDVSNVVDMSYMFAGYNYPILGVSQWDVGRGETLSHTFYNATRLEDTLADWDVGSVRDASALLAFSRAEGVAAAEQDLSGWRACSAVTFASAFHGREMPVASLPGLTCGSLSTGVWVAAVLGTCHIVLYFASNVRVSREGF